MKTLLAIFLSALTASVQWSACNTAGKLVGVRYDSGDVVTLPMPGPKSRPDYVAFLTEPLVQSIAGKTITATVRIDAPTGTLYTVGSGGGVPSLRLYFTTATGPFNFNDSDSKHQLNYWWSDTAFASLDSLDDGLTVTISAVVDPAWIWTASHGQDARQYPADFAAACANCHQIGIALGGHYFDVGVAANNQTSVLHVTSFTVQ